MNKFFLTLMTEAAAPTLGFAELIPTLAMVVGMILTAVLSFADGSVLTSSVKNLWKKGAALPGICWQGVVIFIVIAVIELKWKLNTILSITIAGLLGLALFSI